MRIIGGQFRGRNLNAPTDKNIRPTTGRIRETIFNILTHSPVCLQGASVLDVFAGSGAMGIEALSRGAGHATFFDKDPKSLQLIKKNIALLGLEDKSDIKCVTAPIFPVTRKMYNFIFLDPPYNLDMNNEVISKLFHKNILAKNCIIVTENHKDNSFILNDNFYIYKEKICGISRLTFYIKA